MTRIPLDTHLKWVLEVRKGTQTQNLSYFGWKLTVRHYFYYDTRPDTLKIPWIPQDTHVSRVQDENN